ncbi:hypothetical protein [Hanstruepera ponticola]|uniref:hypothetical protein n=1 Tax=Hanstruepera ponticola TaxID=2042995 RepID=UPI00177ED19E|nr:hypothetical protein [Hanstruepera ponticola]
MKLIFILLALVVVILIVRIITKNRNTQESQISAFEHPSTFKKPPIEMSTKEPIKSISFDKDDVMKSDDAFNVTKN